MFQWLLHVCLISIELSVLVPQETTSTLKLKHTSYHHTIDLQAMAIWFRAKWKLEQTHSSGQLLMCFPEACSDWNATSITCVWKPRQQKSQFRPIRWHVICQHWPPEADLRTRTASIRFFSTKIVLYRGLGSTKTITSMINDFCSMIKPSTDIKLVQLDWKAPRPSVSRTSPVNRGRGLPRDWRKEEKWWFL